jgi:sugar/nucleoside kinase (ribokinase family)
MSIIVLGTVALDTVKTPCGVRKKMLGGSAVHFSMSGRLFTKINLVACIGEDFPSSYFEFLRRKGLILASVNKSKGKTFFWQGEYKRDFNTAITLNTQLGVLSDFKPLISERQRKIKHIFLANIDPDIQIDVLKKFKSPRVVALDSMNYWINHKRKSLLRVLKMVDIYVANDQEARALSQEHNLITAAKRLSSLGPKMILIKKGEHGVIFYSDKFIFAVPAYPAEKVIDPTGAGDTFAGGFMGYLAKAKKLNQASIKKAVAYGTVAASFNVEGFGVEKTSTITFSDLQERLNNFKKIIVF